jgi:hypothetical protein
MAKKRPSGTQPSQQANVHPEAQQNVRRDVADESSSKANSKAKQHDARTGHDKDGNEQQNRTNEKRG